jgi:predicted MFS family arabinose efflux permease
MNTRGYAIVTASYWALTLTDGALRMLVTLYFHQLGYSALDLALLFLLYEFCGIVTNLLGGWLATRLGLRVTLLSGLGLQVIALLMLSFVQPTWALVLSVSYVMAAQALSGIAKDLMKLGSKSAVKAFVPERDASALFRWVGWLTGSKNALKGLGFFMGGVMLDTIGFTMSLWIMATGLLAVLVLATGQLRKNLGKSQHQLAFSKMFSRSSAINILSLGRLCLFGSRDVWFVVALPLFLIEVVGWNFAWVGACLASWVIGYGLVQAVAPRALRVLGESVITARTARICGNVLIMVSGGLAMGASSGMPSISLVLTGLALFGIVFALNSSVHSYLVLAYAEVDTVTMDVGFYYMANAVGRLLGTLLSGWLYLETGLAGCLWMSTGLVVTATGLMFALPPIQGELAPTP